MKLRNKKTEEIVDYISFEKSGGQISMYVFDTNKHYYYNSLANLNEEWEDYEEPKEYWCIDWTGGVNHITVLDDIDQYKKDKKEIGNYFETREEAELAVRKLKALKRLKDKGFKFHHVRDVNGVTISHRDLAEYTIIAYSDDNYEVNDDDLDLLFGVGDTNVTKIGGEE